METRTGRAGRLERINLRAAAFKGSGSSANVTKRASSTTERAKRAEAKKGTVEGGQIFE